MLGPRVHRIRKVAALLLALLIGCGPISPRRSLEESRAQRRQEFEAESKEGPVIKAAWDLKEKLKKDYREIIGPSEAYDEMIELKFSNIINQAGLDTPGYFERMIKKWDTTKHGPPPSREEVQNSIKVLEGRIKKLEDHIAKELAAAEEQAKEDAERRRKIIQVIAGIALVALAAAAGAAGGAAAGAPIYQPSYSYGSYTIIRHGSNLYSVMTPTGRTYSCQVFGSGQVSQVNCH